MSEDNHPVLEHRLTRRELLRLGFAGVCSMGLTGLAGCLRQTGPDSEVLDSVEKGFVNPQPSPWYTTAANDSIRCELCPKQCRLGAGERGPCRVREHNNGQLVTLAYGNPVMIQDDPVERNPFFHVHPGCRVLSLSTAGCNLACRFCEVWDMALVAPEDVYAHDMPPEKTVEHAKTTGVSGISYAFGEPVVFYEYMRAVAALAQQAGMLNLVQTAGYIQPEPLKELCPYLDAANIDLKSFDPDFYRQAVGGELDPVLNTLKTLRRAGVHIEITHLVIPTLNDDLAVLRRMCRWIVAELGPDVPIHFARFYPLYKLQDLPRTPVTTLDQARETALEAGLHFVYVARVTGHIGENTFCPECGETIIAREGFVVDHLHLEEGHCRSCEAAIPGLWA